MKFNRVAVLFAALLALAASAPAQNESAASMITNSMPIYHSVIPPRRASIIFIACHGLGFGDLSCYGQTNFQTPNLDRLATEGTRFTNYRVTGDDLQDAQAALMAGKPAPFPNGHLTAIARLQQAGYHTGLIGEWTLGPQPWTQGFDEFAGFLNEQTAKNYYSDFIWRYAPKSIVDETNRTIKAWSGQEEIYANTGGKKGRFIPDVLMSAAINFVKNNHPDFANRYRPFFLLVNLPLPESVTPGQDDFPVPTDAPFGGEKWPQSAKNRAALLTRLDDSVGRLVEQLNTLDMSNSVAIFVAGGAAPEPFASTNLNFLKIKDEVRGGSSEDRLRVPMLVRWLGHVPAGRVSPAPWNAPDFAPTVLQIGFAKPPPDFTGTSILATLLGKQATNTPAVPNHTGPL
jgi:arylsulfatase A-like enzyme